MSSHVSAFALRCPSHLHRSSMSDRLVLEIRSREFLEVKLCRRNVTVEFRIGFTPEPLNHFTVDPLFPVPLWLTSIPAWRDAF